MESRSLLHVKNAAARKFLVEGFTFSPQHDLWFALGFPHIVLFDPAHKGDKEPVATAIQMLEAWSVSTFMPPVTLARICRVWGVRGFQHPRGGGDRQLTEAGRRAIENDAPIDEAEAEAWIKDLFDEPDWAQMPREQLLGTEALVGPSPVVRGALSAMSTWSEDRWREQDGERFGQMLHLGMALWRLPQKEHDQARKQLDKLRPDTPIAPVEQHGLPSAQHGLALALEGADAAKRVCQKAASVLSFSDLSHAFGDPQYVRDGVAAFNYPAGAEPDARRVFLGGEEILDTELSWWSKYQTPGAVSMIVQTYGFIRSPKTVDLMLAIYGKGKAKRAVKQWFTDHWSYAEPLVTKAKRRKGFGDAAAQLLASLG